MLTYKGEDFYLNDEKFNIYSGAIHYFRTLPEYWEDRLLKLKAAGFNTVETYVCWNFHEPVKGEFNFSGMYDIERFVQTANDLGLYAIVRPGPYICAEWDLGGLPPWLLRDKNMSLRCLDEKYLQHVSDFYRELLGRLHKHQITNGGNIIAMQIENEYGSYGNDKKYLAFIEELMRSCGVDVLLFTSDGPTHNMLSGGTLPHVLKTGNFGSASRFNFNFLKKYETDGPMMCMEFWNGWFDHWGEKIHHTRSGNTVVPELKYMLKHNCNFNFYMFHGGTNFGFGAGANMHGSYTPTVTSYDYDAPLTEWGGYTKKYHAIRNTMLSHLGIETTLPPEPKLQSIGSVNLTQSAGLFTSLKSIAQKHHSAAPLNMEHYGQNFGLILYQTKVSGKYNQKLELAGLADRAYVFVNDEYKGVIYRNDKSHSLAIGSISGETDIKVLVDAMGRVNYGARLDDRKGVSQIRLGAQLLFDWDVYTIPLDNLEKLTFGTQASTERPVFLKGTFNTSSKDDCFVHLDGFTKGYVFVNGFNLGRYWAAGPQKALYLPGALLKDENEIIVFEQESFAKPAISITDKPNIGKTKFSWFK